LTALLVLFVQPTCSVKVLWKANFVVRVISSILDSQYQQQHSQCRFPVFRLSKDGYKFIRTRSI